MTPEELWAFLPLGYAFTVAIELPVLLVGLSGRHNWQARLIAGFWLTACTYPIVVLVLPLLFDADSRIAYLAGAETFAPAAECALFWAIWIREQPANRRATFHDLAAIVVANLASFGLGEVAHHYGWFDNLLG